MGDEEICKSPELALLIRVLVWPALARLAYDLRSKNRLLCDSTCNGTGGGLLLERGVAAVLGVAPTCAQGRCRWPVPPAPSRLGLACFTINIKLRDEEVQLTSGY